MLAKLKNKLEASMTLSDELWKEIKDTRVEKHIKKGETIINYSSINRKVHIVISGAFETSLISTNGDKQTTWFHFDELFDVVVCFDSYYLNEPTKYEVVALENAEVCIFHKDALDSLRKKYPEMNEFYINEIIGDTIHLAEIRNHMIAHTPKEFLAYLKKHYPIFLERTPSNKLAQFMSITPEWLSKIKKGLDF